VVRRYTRLLIVVIAAVFLASACGAEKEPPATPTTYPNLFGDGPSTTTVPPLQVPGWTSRELPELRAEAERCASDADIQPVEMPEDGPPTVVVEPGDTLGEIAKRFDRTVEEFMRANGIDDPHKLAVGQQLVVPHKRSEELEVPDGPTILYMDLTCEIDVRVAAFGPDGQPIGGAGVIEVFIRWLRIEGPREAPKVNGRLRGLVQADAVAFLGDVVDAVEQNGYACRTSFDGRCMWLQQEYQVMLATEDYLSVRNTLRRLMPGAVGDASEIRAETFDLSTGRPIAIGDLFDPATDWVPVLSAAAIERLGNEPWTDDRRFTGAGPQAANFTRFNLTAGGLVLSFPPLTVGGSGTNTLSVTVPYRTLDGYWAPDGPVPMIG
jgi:LysM repeat protein